MEILKFNVFNFLNKSKKTTVSLAVLNIIRFPHRDPTGFCNSEPDPDRIWISKLHHCSKMLNQSFFGHEPDWIKYLDRSTG